MLWRIALYSEATTKRTRRARSISKTWGDLQREVVRVVWAHAPVTAETVRKRLSRPLEGVHGAHRAASTRGKGYITHTVDGRTYVYDAATPRRQVAARAVRRIATGCATDPSRKCWSAWLTPT
jgi:predicted transcriptional regulator